MKTKEQKLPKWFDGEVYDKGAVVQNRFGGAKIELNNIELSMYDFIMGATTVMEAREGYNSLMDASFIHDLRKGLSWFRTHSPEAYMVLLD